MPGISPGSLLRLIVADKQELYTSTQISLICKLAHIVGLGVHNMQRHSDAFVLILLVGTQQVVALKGTIKVVNEAGDLNNQVRRLTAHLGLDGNFLPSISAICVDVCNAHNKEAEATTFETI